MVDCTVFLLLLNFSILSVEREHNFKRCLHRLPVYHVLDLAHSLVLILRNEMTNRGASNRDLLTPIAQQKSHWATYENS